MKRSLSAGVLFVATATAVHGCILPGLEVDESLGGEGGTGGSTATGAGGEGGEAAVAGGTATGAGGTSTGPGGASAGGGAGCDFDECSGACVDLGSSEAHCGMCGNACTSSTACLDGECCEPHPAGGACNLEGCGCEDGEVCYPDDPDTGLQCFTSDDLEAGDVCLGSGVCAQGLGCFGGLCKPYCTEGAQCEEVDGVSECLETFYAADGSAIPGVSVCPTVCDAAVPTSTEFGLRPCPEDFGCFPHPDGASDCFPQGGTGRTGDACDSNDDCAPGTLCSPSVSLCREFCFFDEDCVGGGTCVFDLASEFGEALFAGSFEVGQCVICDDTCETFPMDGDCDDGGPNSDFSLCALGTDCTDCGRR
jgi:hypothetical protein